MGDAIKIIVYDKNGKNVTDERDWMIDKDGDLRYECDDVDCPVVTVGEGFFYELEVTPMGAGGRRLQVTEIKG